MQGQVQVQGPVQGPVRVLVPELVPGLDIPFLWQSFRPSASVLVCRNMHTES